MVTFRDFPDLNRLNEWFDSKNKNEIINIETIRDSNFYRVWYYF